MAPTPSATPANKAKKRAKLQNSRVMKAEIADPSFDKYRRLNIPDFIKAREFEVRSFERAQLKVKASQVARVFQNLPRVLRRRTASHNVKRIPKRLRNRALNEMAKTAKGEKPKGSSKGRLLHMYKLRKRLLKFGAKLKLLRQLPPYVHRSGRKAGLRHQIRDLDRDIAAFEKHRLRKYNNRCGAYDNCALNQLAFRPRGAFAYMHRQKEFVWLPTHVWHAKRFHMVGNNGYKIPLTPLQKCYRSTHRNAKHKCVAMDTSYNDVLLVKNAEPLEFFRRHTKYNDAVPPSLLNGKRSYVGPLYIKDQLTTMGVVLVNHGKIMVRVHAQDYEYIFKSLKKSYAIEDCRYAIGSIDLMGPLALLELSQIIHPVLNDPHWESICSLTDHRNIAVGTTYTLDIRDPRLWKQPLTIPTPLKESDAVKIVRANAEDHVTLSPLFTSHGRSRSYENVLPVKELDKKFREAGSMSNSVSQDIISKTSIPIVVIKTTVGWTVLIPWYWVLPVWIKLVRLPKVHPIGFQQLYQINFENFRPTYPYDFPWLAAGAKYNYANGWLLKSKYQMKEKKYSRDSHEDYANPDFMNPFECDWSSLRALVFLKQLYKLTPEKLLEGANPNVEFDESDIKINDYKDLRVAVTRTGNNEGQLRCTTTKTTDIPIVRSFGDIRKTNLPIQLIGITCDKGTITDRARLFVGNHRNLCDIVGFVTTGNFNLDIGHALGLAYVVAGTDINNLYVRNVGCSNFYPVTARNLTMF